MDDPLPAFGANLRSRREAQHLTQDALGEAAEMDAAEIRRIESGRRDPGVRVVVRLARALRIPPSDMLDGLQ